MYINEYELAYDIALKAHKGQKDKGGEDYFKHPLAVSVITKKAGEYYEEYLNRVKQNPIALRVKIADMEHNSDISRIKNPTEKDLKRLEKYKIRLMELRETLETDR